MEKYYYAVGRRKTSVATVRLFEGKGESTLNGKPISEIYNLPQDKQKLFLPLKVVDGIDKFYFTAVAHSGGRSGQRDSIVHALARALVKFDPELKPALKAESLMTRDDRKVERKKTGLRKARKAPQFSKR